MKYIVFGTGKYCLEYCKYIDSERILCFIDNDGSKIGTKFNGKLVCAIQRVFQEDYDYVIVLVKNYFVIIEQLLELGIAKEKVIPFHKLYDLEEIPQRIVSKNKETSVYQWAENRRGKKIFICSHNFSRSGVPVALMNLALLLKKMDYEILLAALGHGSLEEELCLNGIDYISDIKYLYASERFVGQLKGFDLIVLGTLAIAEVGTYFSELDIPIMWWLHESDDDYYNQYKLPVNIGNIHYYGVGKRVLNKFNQIYPEESIKELLYFLPDIQIQSHNYSEERIFALIGFFCKRKAQDILISAIKDLPDEVRQKCVFYFIGVTRDEDGKMMGDLCREFSQIHYIYEMSQKDVAVFYQKIDVLICPSRDDPMPIVVTQALQNGVPCIVSSEVGQREYLAENGGGTVFPSEDVAVLKQQITEFALCPAKELEEYSKSAGKIFDMYFSKKIMEQNLYKILDELLVD